MYAYLKIKIKAKKIAKQLKHLTGHLISAIKLLSISKILVGANNR